MRVYLAGPMRGIPEFNFPAFLEAGEELNTAGHLVFNPARHDIDNGFPYQGTTGNEDLSDLGLSLREALSTDTGFITQAADVIALLPGWEASSGARAEMALAAALGLRAGTVNMVTTWDAEALPLAAEILEGRAASAAAGQSPDGEVRITNAATGGQKGQKVERFDLVPIHPLTELARHYGIGARKYDDNQWMKGYDWSLSYAALLRHVTAFWAGEDIDAETGSPHMAAVAWHAFALLQFAKDHPELDNRATTLARHQVDLELPVNASGEGYPKGLIPNPHKIKETHK